jgi:hypothetical protein
VRSTEREEVVGVHTVIGVGLCRFIDGGWALLATVGEEDTEQWRSGVAVSASGVVGRGAEEAVDFPSLQCFPLDRTRDGGGVKLWQ